jgi:taurine dioxygenase
MSRTNSANNSSPATPFVNANLSGIEILPLDAPLGAEVRCDVRSLDQDGAAVIHQAFLDNLALLIRGQEMNDEDLMRFGSMLGELAAPLPPEHGAEGARTSDENKYPMVSVVSNVVENGKTIGGLGDGEAQWHTDFSYHEIPYAASILYALEIPNTWGGDTSVLNMYAALEALPNALRRQIEGMTIKGDQSMNSAGQRRKGVPETVDVRTSPGPSHPIVRTHPETGHNALYLGRRTFAYVNGLPIDESEELLNELWAHATKGEFTYTNKWQVGDILMWDNRCAMHHRKGFDPNARRIMHRVQTGGDRPTYSMRKSKNEPHPRSILNANY